MKPAITLLTLLFCFANAAAGPSTQPAATPTIDVWPAGKMPGKGASSPRAEMESKRDAYHRITNVSQPTLTFFPAPKTGQPTPIVVVCPGGGYHHVVVDKEGSEIAAWLNAAGISAAVLEYRVPSNPAGALQDLQRAIRLTRARATDWNVDPKRVGVIGFSAGGNLAAKASTLADDSSYTPIDSIDQQSCRPDFAMLVYPAYLEKGGKLAPELKISQRIPPTLIVHNEDDKALVAGSKLYDAALEAGKVPHQFLLYSSGGHGYGLHCAGEARAWPDAALKWLHSIGVP